MARLSLSLLGPPKITLNGQPVSGFAYNKARALLIFLAVEADRPHSRDALVGLLWPDLPDSSARTNLRQALANLRDAVGDAFLIATRDSLQLNPHSDYELDAATFEALMSACQAHSHRHLDRCASCVKRLEQAVTLYRGDFLEGFSVNDSAPFEEWVLLKRERVHQDALNALSRLTAYYERGGEYEAARHTARRQLEFDPWREEAHQQLMRLLALAGQRSAALAQYETCRRVLAESLNVEPSRETMALYQLIRDGEEGAAFGQPGRRWARAASLPASPTPLIGRETELADLGEMLENPTYRLITILGPGGIGKTRLALAAAEQTQAFEDGVVFVSLASLGSAELLTPTLLAALHILPEGSRDPKEQLIEFLRTREMLLVLDNFDHLLDGVGLLAEWIAQAPNIALLVTSRERLALHAEWLLDLGGLSYPTEEEAGGLENYSAVQLFAQRARQTTKDFSWAQDNGRAMLKLCQLVEGMPLAIELAAAGVRTCSCAVIVSEIERNLRSLETTLRDVPERHRSMWAAFEHSWNLLSEEERNGFRRLAIFRGGFQPEYASHVAEAPAALLAALQDKSLVRRDATGRYDLHELIRQYAYEKLIEAGEQEVIRDRHAACFVALAEGAEPHLYSADQQLWFDRLERDHDNLRTAIRWMLDGGEVEACARLIMSSVWRFWWIRGHVSEGRRWAGELLESGGALTPFAHAKMLSVAGVLAKEQGDYAEAAGYYQDALALRRQQNDRHGVAVSLGNLGVLAQLQGELEQACQFLSESLTTFRELGDLRNVGVQLQAYGLTKVYQGEFGSAQALLEENLSLRQERGDRWGIAAALTGLGDIAYYQGDYARAQSLYAESLSISRQIEDRPNTVQMLTSLGHVARRQARLAEALVLYEEALTMWNEIRGGREIVSILVGIAALDLEKGHLTRAVSLLAAAQLLIEELGVVLWPVELPEFSAIRHDARVRFGESAFERAWAEGRTMTLEEAIGYAVEDDDS